MCDSASTYLLNMNICEHVCNLTAGLVMCHVFFQVNTWANINTMFDKVCLQASLNPEL